MQVGPKFKSQDVDGNDKATGPLVFLSPKASKSNQGDARGSEGVA